MLTAMLELAEPIFVAPPKILLKALSSTFSHGDTSFRSSNDGQPIYGHQHGDHPNESESYTYPKCSDVYDDHTADKARIVRSLPLHYVLE